MKKILKIMFLMFFVFFAGCGEEAKTTESEQVFPKYETVTLNMENYQSYILIAKTIDKNGASYIDFCGAKENFVYKNVVVTWDSAKLWNGEWLHQWGERGQGNLKLTMNGQGRIAHEDYLFTIQFRILDISGEVELWDFVKEYG